MKELKELVPKTKTKIDYKPESMGDKGYFVVAVVERSEKQPKEKGSKDPTQYKLTISYVIENQAK